MWGFNILDMRHILLSRAQRGCGCLHLNESRIISLINAQTHSALLWACGAGYKGYHLGICDIFALT